MYISNCLLDFSSCDFSDAEGRSNLIQLRVQFTIVDHKAKLMKTVKQWMHIKEVVMLWLGVGDGGESCCHAIVCDGDDIVEVVNFFVNRNMILQAIRLFKHFIA